MAHFIISVMAQDRTGIVADVTGAVKSLKGNLEDMTQTVMRGYFTMILLAQFPEDLQEQQLQQQLQQNSALAGLHITTTPFVKNDQTPQADEDALYVLTSSGPDKPGIVATTAEALRQKNINIVDLNTRTSKGNYNMMFLVSIPKGTDIAKLKRSLQIIMEDLGLAIELRHQDIFRKTNEI